jgi:hypothetical protein
MGTKNYKCSDCVYYYQTPGVGSNSAVKKCCIEPLPIARCGNLPACKQIRLKDVS